MDHGVDLISPILKILEIEVCNILYNPGNIEKLSFSIFSYPGNIGNLEILENCCCLASTILEIYMRENLIGY